MNKTKRLSFSEFLGDIRGVVTSPSRRFALIQERGAAWGSLVLLILPAYFGFAWAGGIYFDRDPFYGYAFLTPAVLATIATFLKLFLIHFVARLFEGRGHYSRAHGRFRQMITVFGYTTVPAIIALVLAAVIFLAAPGEISTAFRDFRTLSWSFMIALSASLFLWNLILVVLALRVVYLMRDLKIVASFLLGLILTAIPAMGAMLVVTEVKVDSAFLQPILADRILQLHAAEAGPGAAREVMIQIHVDLLAYHLKSPKRFDLVAFTPFPDYFQKKGREGGRIVVGGRAWLALHREEQVVGRILGLPGDQVELSSGRLRVNGQFLDEPYLPPERASTVSIPARQLGPSEYFVLPDDRELMKTYPDEWVVPRQGITGRVVTNRWPMGWLIYRSSAFYRPPLENRP
jgi:signal peptidase I